MRLPFAICLIAIGSAIPSPTGVARADGFTTRIETRPYYGAVTTVEHGVRVIRPLPPDRYVIINPNRTPLALSFSENNVYDYSSGGGYGSTRTGRHDLGASNPDGPIYNYPSYGRRFWRGHKGFGHFRNGHRGNFAGGPRGKGSPGAMGLH